MEKHMTDKTAVVTGATNGIGLITARELARMGARTYLVGRSRERCQNAVEAIRRADPAAQVDYLLADLSAQADVRRVAEEIRARTNRLDVLINNAGAVFSRRRESADGIEMTLALNHLSPFLLTHLLLDRLTAAAPARVINLSSVAHQWTSFNFRDPQMRRLYIGWIAYYQSKLANVYFTYELARRLAGNGVTANCLHPGLVATRMGQNNGLFFRTLFKLVNLGAITPEQGAETSIYLASSPDVAAVSGQYFYQKHPIRSSRVSYDETAARQLWDLSLKLTGLG